MRLRTGSTVEIEFLDHVENGSVPARFTVYGRLSKITKRALCVDCWCYSNRKIMYDSNVNRFTIVRSAITKIYALKPQRLL
jgi:hypothetical protein